MQRLTALRVGFVLIPFVSLMATQGGCTVRIWQLATYETRYYSGIDGVGRSPDGQPQLVLSYGGESHVVLPLDSTGSPPALFVYTGSQRRVAAIVADLLAGRVKEIEQYVFDENSKALARRAMRSHDYYDFADSIGPEFRSHWHYAWHNRLVVVALGPDGMTRQGTEVKGDNGEIDYLLGDDCKILILPEGQPRTKAEINADIALAVVFTPVAIATDIAIIPLGLFMKAVTGYC